MTLPTHASLASSTKLTAVHRAVDMDWIERILLPKVLKPGRYLGLEQGVAGKRFEDVKATMALAFPDLYEIGMSSYAIKLLYSVVNRHPDYLCDRIYAPALDFKALLAEHQLPLYAVESKRPLAAFDLVAVSLQYELNYTTALGLLDSAQFPLLAQERRELPLPVVLAGGPGATHPAPVAPFFDGFLIGDGEELLLEVLACIEAHKREVGDAWHEKQRLLETLSNIQGVFIPGITQHTVEKRIVDIAANQVELYPLIPTVEAVHDRVTIEARRGCDRMCRFCQPCFINLPVREQHIDTIKENALKELHKTGYEECSLLSLSIADYSQLTPLVKEVAGALRQQGASLSLPSQRADRFNLEVAQEVQSVRKSTLTFAPEAGSARLRDVINKNLSDKEIQDAVTTAYRAGWNKVKLYFMIGLPTETQEDLDGIVQTVKKLQWLCNDIRQELGDMKRPRLDVNLTISNFVPKPHTPFQWCPQETVASFKEKIACLRKQFAPMRGVKMNYTDPEISKFEAVIAKADEQFAPAILYAYQAGAYLDAWDMTQNADKWLAAMRSVGLDPEAYTRDRLTELDEPLPWDVIDVGVDKAWLQEEYRRAMKAASTVPCFDACSACGVCGKFGVWPSFTQDVAAPSNGFQHRYARPVESEGDTPVEGVTPSRLKLAPTARLRMKIQKRGQQRFMSHLDWMRALQRALVRAELPVAYTQGFNPRPKVSFSPALPLFTESEGEWVDVDLTEPVYNAKKRLNELLSSEGQVLEATLIPLTTPSIESQLHSMTYVASTPCGDPMDPGMIREKIETLMSQPEWIVQVETKKGSITLDLRSGIQDFSYTLQSSMLQCRFTLKKPLLEDGMLAASPQTSPSPAGLSRWVKPDWILSYLTQSFMTAAPEAAASAEKVPPSLPWRLSRVQLALETHP